MVLGTHYIAGQWEARSETPAGLTCRLLEFLEKLRAINPVFGNWIWAEDLKPVFQDETSESIKASTVRHIERLCRDSSGKNAYRIFFGNTASKSPHGIMIFMRAGQANGDEFGINNVIMQTHNGVEPDPAIVTYDIFRPALLALVESFEVSWCCAYSSAMDLPRGVGAKPFHRAWMSYVAPHLAPLIEPPASATVEPPASATVEIRPNGGVFMAATTETYNDKIPTHRAVAQVIADAVAPLAHHRWTMSLDAEPDDPEPPELDKPSLGAHTIFGHWGPRAETPDAIASRFRALLDRLAQIDPLFGHWICAKDKKPVPFEVIKDTLADEIDAEAKSDPEFDHWPGEGYGFFAINGMDDGPRSISVSFHAGCTVSVSIIVNSAAIETPFNREPDPAMITYAIFKPALLALAETFAMSWCLAYPRSLTKPGSGVGGSPFHRAWMSYVAPEFAALIHPPPPQAIVEIRPDGGIFMAATTERYDDANPAHQAVARAIEACVAPLNDYPWKMRLDEA